MNHNDWDMRFLRLAGHIAAWSKDPSTQTGAVVIDDKRRIVSLGYNGLPQGVADTPERLNVRETKYKIIVHCERNAIIFAQRDLHACTLYTWPFMSCSTCAAMVIQAGITRVVAPRSDNPRWVEDFKLSTELFTEAGVTIDLYDVPELLMPPTQELVTAPKRKGFWSKFFGRRTNLIGPY